MKIKLEDKIFQLISDLSKTENKDVYIIGGYVRDLILNRPSKDIDFVIIGSGIEFAKKLAKKISPKLEVVTFKNFGTAMFKYNNTEYEFVGARKESYQRNSRKPIVENGTLEDDQNRRDFTINALAISMNKKTFGEVIDPFNGLTDIENKIIRTPLDPNITFSDDPLRMMRAIRFASQLNFKIHKTAFDAIKDNVERINIISKERISDELNKILLSSKPSVGLKLLFNTGLVNLIFPELSQMYGIERIEGIGHKDNFLHTLKVVDNISKKTDNLWLRWAALLHDIGKPKTKKFENNNWTFHGHQIIGANMITGIFRRLKLPMNDKMKYVKKLVELHHRPIALTNEQITDSAVRRLIYETGNDINDLMLLVESDITTQFEYKQKRFLNNFKRLRKKIKEVEENDFIKNWQPPIDGNDIMKILNLEPCSLVGELKTAIKDSILDGKIENSYESAYAYLMELAKKFDIINN